MYRDQHRLGPGTSPTAAVVTQGSLLSTVVSLSHQNETEVVSVDMSLPGHSLDISIEAFTSRTTGELGTVLL